MFKLFETLLTIIDFIQIYIGIKICTPS